MKFKIGDKVKIRKDVTLEEISNNNFNGCQSATFWFLRGCFFSQRSVDNTYIIKDVAYDRAVKILNIRDQWINNVIFEKVEEIIDNKEKEYLKGVIKPFRKDVESITKMDNLDGKEYIVIYLKNTDRAFLPNFKKGTMYKNMKTNKMYTVKELGL